MLVSCSPVFNELDVLEIRLRELYRVVDRFVLVEATVTHSGRSKPLYVSDAVASGRFDPWLDKVDLRVVDLQEKEPWGREVEQRERLLDALSDCDDGTLVLLSDVDEIPRAEVMRRIRLMRQVPVHLPLPMHLYWLNWRWWPEVTRAYSISKVFPLAMARASSMDAVREDHSFPFPSFTGEFPDGLGWHFAYQADPVVIAEKLRASAHTELDTLGAHERVRESLQDGVDIFGRDRTISEAPWESLPECVQDGFFDHMVRRA